jgi:hypothetical protein
MRESLMYGSVRGARGNSRPYRDVFDIPVWVIFCPRPMKRAPAAGPLLIQ